MRCHALSELVDRTDLAATAGPAGVPAVLSALAGPAGELLDRHAADRQRRAGAVALLKRYGTPRYAHLIARERLATASPTTTAVGTGMKP